MGGRTTNRRALQFLAAAVLVAAMFGIAFYVVAAVSAPGSKQFDRTALAYSQQMVWQSGPNVRSTHVIRLHDLKTALHRYVFPRVASDVNTGDLIRRFGANRRVALVVLSGVYNSLPPDEGVMIHGQAVVLIDARTNHGLFLTN
ncbi:MAG: hypothetical protein ACRDFX_00600 [Chloroflexota bacterium]